MIIDLKTTKNVVFQKPDAIDTPIYEKPNAYDEEPPTVTASRHGSRSSKMTVDSFASRYFQRKEPTIVSSLSTPPPSTLSSVDCYSPNTPVESPPLSPKSAIRKETSMYCSQIDYQHITSFILSQPTPTTQTNFGHHHEDNITIKDYNTPFSYYVIPSSPANSIAGIDTTITASTPTPAPATAAAAAAILSNDSGIVSSFFLQQTKRNTTAKTSRKIPNNNMVVYSFKKASILKPNQHQIYLHIDHPDDDDEEVMVYRKIQPYSYTWGFQSMLYCNKNDGQGIKVAEARRRPFQTDIIIESADYNNSEIEDIAQPYINNLKNIPATQNIHSQDLIKRSQSNILFEYEIWFHGSRMRWKRPSLLSHDFTCEIKLTRQETKILQQQKKSTGSQSKRKKNNSIRSKTKDDGFIDSDSDNDEDDHDNHSHKSCRRWKLIAEFDSDNMGFTSKEFGRLSIDLDILNQVEKERCDLLEANLVMTCCTLIDLIRDIMGK